MEIKDKIIVITGGASGIGRAMARRFTDEGAKQIVIADLNADGLQEVADEIGARAIPTNVAVEAEVKHLIETAENDYGQIDLLCN
ncbi:MAG TPA: SDR family NAD(P)-dependent oxidoreductase, partial [Gammaproteobacteria bacterium]|nr:SDR family NAD(P)-dependent oxidoreductase [Gammaproteobacteria bacterium]